MADDFDLKYYATSLVFLCLLANPRFTIPIDTCHSGEVAVGNVEVGRQPTALLSDLFVNRVPTKIASKMDHEGGFARTMDKRGSQRSSGMRCTAA